MMRYVFVSHANLDKPALKSILQALLAAGIPLWIDRPREVGLAEHRLVLPGIRSGLDWDTEIRKAFENAACVLFFLSRNSNNPARSDSLFREFDYGSANEKLVIAKLDDIAREEMDGLIRIRQAVDVSKLREGSVGLEGLIAELHRFVLTESELPGRPMPVRSKKFARLLPYLCDRHTQRRRFCEAVEIELDRDSVRPQFFFVVGEDSQCADKFVEQLYSVDLPDVLQRNRFSGPVESRLLRWVPDLASHAGADEINDHLSGLEFELATKVGESTRSGIVGIERYLSQQNGALFVYSDINLRKWSDGQRRLLSGWVDWWSRLKTAGRRYPIVVVARFCFAGARLSPFGIQPPTTSVLKDLSNLAKAADERVAVTVLPQLNHISYEDIEAWLHDHPDLEAEAPRDLELRLRKLFSGVFGIGERKLPMSKVATFLEKIIDEMKVSPDPSLSRGSA